MKNVHFKRRAIVSAVQAACVVSFPALFAGLFFSAAAHAQTPGQSTLPEVRVTASPVIDSNTTDNFGSIRTDVTAEQVRDLGAQDLAGALRRTPGMTISRFNPVGSFGGDEGGGVFIRGLGASRPGSEIKTYIDGVPFYMGVWNHPLLDLLPLNGMERISIYKGPQPQVVGNTFGAIDLTPRKTRREGMSGNLRLSAGGFNTFIEQADVAGRGGDWDYSFAQGYAKSDGHRADAGGKLANAMGSVGYRINPQWSIGLTLLHAENKVSDPGQEGLPATKTGQFNTRGDLAGLTVRHDHGWAKGSFKIYQNSGSGQWRGQPAAPAPAATGDTLSAFRLSGVKLREQLKPWKGGEIVAGLDIDSMGGDVTFNPVAAASSNFRGQTIRVTSPYSAINQTLELGGGWSAIPSAGVRSYRHSELGGATAPHAGLIVRNADSLALRANVSRGINYPGLDVVVLSTIVAGGALGQTWRTLSPERLDHTELGFTWTPSASTTVDFAAFKDRLKNRYMFAFPPAVAAATFINLANYDVRGTETTIQHQFSRSWQVFVGITTMQSTRADLPYAPKSVFVFGNTVSHGAWRVSVDAQYQTSMYVLQQARANGSINGASVPGFATANARVSYALPALGPRGEVFASVENLFNAKYAYRPGYPMPGTWGQVGVNLSF